MGIGLFCQIKSDRTRENGFRLCRRGFRLDIGEIFSLKGQFCGSVIGRRQLPLIPTTSVIGIPYFWRAKGALQLPDLYGVCYFLPVIEHVVTIGQRHIQGDLCIFLCNSKEAGGSEGPQSN